MNFKEKLKAWQGQVNQSLEKTLPLESERPSQLHRAIRYTMQAGGKRLRPILTLSAHGLFPNQRDPLPAALAIEYIHTYSLIHDDLPAMDDSDMRRGQVTCHKAFDEATAILAGDALQPMAFELLANSYGDEPNLSIDLIKVLAETAGSKKLVGGQMQDLISEGMAPDAENLSFIHENKTAAMIRASLEMGFRLGGMGDDLIKVKHIREAGTFLGLAFQAVDDLLDVTGSTDELGKDARHDMALGKVTWVTLRGEASAREMASDYTQKARESLERVGGEQEFLVELISYMLTRKS